MAELKKYTNAHVLELTWKKPVLGWDFKLIEAQNFVTTLMFEAENLIRCNLIVLIKFSRGNTSMKNTTYVVRQIKLHIFSHFFQKSMWNISCKKKEILYQVWNVHITHSFLYIQLIVLYLLQVSGRECWSWWNWDNFTFQVYIVKYDYSFPFVE